MERLMEHPRKWILKEFFMHFFHSSSHSNAVVLYINWFRNKKKYVTQAYLMLNISMKAPSCVVKKVLKRSQKDAVSGRLPNKLKQHSFCNSARFFLLCTESEFHNPLDLLNPNRDNKSTDGIIRKISCNVSLSTFSKPVKRMNTSIISNTYMCFYL